MNPTQNQRDKYRAKLEARGMPEVLAFMAAQNFAFQNKDRLMSKMLLWGFIWVDTKEGHDFWATVQDNCKAVEATQ